MPDKPLKPCPHCGRPARAYGVGAYGIVRCGRKLDGEDGCGSRIESRKGIDDAKAKWERRTGEK